MVAGLERRRKIILIAFIVIVLIFVFQIGFIGENVITSKINSEALVRETAKLKHNLTLAFIRAQSNELKYLSETWHNWSWATKPDDIYQEFVDRMIVGRSGVDGSRITITFDDSGKLLHAGAGATKYINTLLPYVFEEREYLYPDYIFCHDVYWNKLVIPTPTNVGKKIVIFYGFTEQFLKNELNIEFVETQDRANAINQNNAIIFWSLSSMMFAIIVLGMVIAVNLRETEGEVSRIIPSKKGE